MIIYKYNIITHGKNRKEMMTWFKSHIDILNDLTVLKINERRRKHFVDTNLLKLTNLVYTRDSRLVYTFEYKIPRIEETQ